MSDRASAGRDRPADAGILLPRHLRPASIRCPVDPRDIPPSKAARRLGLTEAQFLERQDELFARGFPRPDSTTGQYDLKAIDAWMDMRSSLTAPADARHAPEALREAFHAWRPEPPRNRRRQA